MKKLFVSILLSFILVQTAFAEGYYYLYDHLGNVDVVTDETGEAVATYEYDPYGNTIEENIYDEDFENDYKYTGQEEDDETGLYYYNARYYSPGLGRFMSQDPAVYDDRLLDMLADPQSLNPYTYARNNPVKYVDPSGEIFGSPDEFAACTIWNWGVIYLYGKGYNIAAQFLQHAIATPVYDVANHDTITFGPNDNIANAIQETSEYASVMNDIISNVSGGILSNSGDLEINSNEDLALSLHGANYTYNAVDLGKGVFEVTITITDTYDFTEFKSDDNLNFVNIANDAANISSNITSYLKEYKVEGTLTDFIHTDN